MFFFRLLFVRLLDCYQKLFNMIEVRVHDMVIKVNDNSKKQQNSLGFETKN